VSSISRSSLDAQRPIRYEVSMLGQMIAQTATETAMVSPYVEHPTGVLVVLLTTLAIIFWLTQQSVASRFFRIVPALVFCYFVPTTLTTLGFIPESSPLYSWVKSFLLPAALLLLVLSLDVPSILRLGSKAVIMLLAGTAGIVIGGPIAFWISLQILPDSWQLPSDAWQGLAALSGSWIGGGANFVAIGEVAGASDVMLATMVIPDVFVANIWMGFLLYMSGFQKRIDARSGADASAIRDLEERMTDFQARTARIATLPDLMIILALGFGGSWMSYKLGLWLPDIGSMITSSTWKFIIVTALGVGLSFTRVRNLEGAGASKIGTVMIYLLVACIGTSADFRKIVEAPGFIIVGFLWMAIHIIVLLGVAKLIRAPVFFVAIGSQANIGGAASAPVVASAFHPSLAPVGALLAVAGYVLGTYAGLLCMSLLRWVAQM
jgi:uncharacterized membrane protein